jgi:hypothetical protein
MDTSFNFCKVLSAIYWNPVDFTIVGEEYELKKAPCMFSNSMNFYIHDFLQDAQDFSFNRRTGTILSKPLYNSKFIKNYVNPKDNEQLSIIESPIIDPISNYVYSVSGLDLTTTLSVKYLVNTQQTVFTKADTLKFEFVPTNYVVVENQDGNVMTVGSDGVTVSFLPRIYPPDPSQLFDYILGKDNIVLFVSNTNFTNVISQGSQVFVDTLILPNSESIPTQYIFKFTSYLNNQTVYTDKDIPNSFFVKYKTTPTNNKNQLNYDEDFISSNSLAQNYLAMFPYEYPYITDTDTNYNIQIHSLKNHQTPEYTYSIANPLISSSPCIRRNYEKLYTGTNQTNGYNNIFLGYQADTQQFTFKVDQENYFYYPALSNRTPLNNAGLIEDGAIAGELPYTSDRISVYKQNYNEIIPGSPQPASITKFDRTWLCSWLSGTNFGKKVWMDRYYNAAYYTIDQALTATAYVYNQKLDPSKPYTFDTPSKIILEPGVLYKYDRTGKNNSKNFLQYLDQETNLSNGGKLLSITRWLSSPILDDSNYHNNGLAYFTSPENYKNDYFILDGSNHVVFPAKKDLLQNSRITVSMWINTKDWSNIYGQQVFGNYFKSGFGLINESSLTTPVLTIVNSASGLIYNVNYKLKKIAELQTPFPYVSGGNISFIQRLPNYNFWIFDSNTRKGILYSEINSIIGNLNASSYISSFDQIEIDQNENIYIYDNTNKRYAIFDVNGKYISTTTVPAGINRIELDQDSNVVLAHGKSSTIDNSGNLWEVIGSNLYLNKTVVANVGFTQQITCDSTGNIWILHQQDRVSKLNTITGLFEFSLRIGEFSSLPPNPCTTQDVFRYINFVKVPVDNNTVCKEDVYYEDRIIIVDNRENQIYILNTYGTLLSKLDLRGLGSDPTIPLDFYAKGDFTGYQYIRKYGSLNKNLSWKLKIAEPNGKNYQLLSLQYSVSSLPEGWHHFVLTFDSFNGVARYYVDTIKVNEVSFTPQKYQIYYDYRSSLFLGAASVRSTTLNDIIGIEDSYKFIGKIAELRMYAKSLTQNEIEQLYFSSNFSDGIKDLTWNMNVGRRSFIEEISHWYQMQLPGSKSKYFNINIHNLNINDNVKVVIEDAIKTNIKKIAPAYTSLYKVNWL